MSASQRRSARSSVREPHDEPWLKNEGEGKGTVTYGPFLRILTCCLFNGYVLLRTCINYQFIHEYNICDLSVLHVYILFMYRLFVVLRMLLICLNVCPFSCLFGLTYSVAYCLHGYLWSPSSLGTGKGSDPLGQRTELAVSKTLPCL